MRPAACFITWKVRPAFGAGAISGIIVAHAIKTEMVLAPLARDNKLPAVMILGGRAAGDIHHFNDQFRRHRIAKPKHRSYQEKGNMSRKALIIANPGRPGETNYCKGVEKDVENYRSFLRSPVGGLWYDSEIIVPHQPGIVQTKVEVLAPSAADYSMTIFCGHGHHSAQSNSTIVELKPGTDLDSHELRRGATYVDTMKTSQFLSVVEAHEVSKKGVNTMSAGRQVPLIDKPRSGGYFPFAIIS